MANHSLGFQPSPIDDRDKSLVGDESSLFGAAVVAPAEYLDLIALMHGINEQGRTNSCVWNAIQTQHYIAQREQGVAFHSLHPGWVDTPGIADALPGFHRLVGPLLRTPEEGADTMVWLTADRAGSATTGRFWLDRAPRPTHRLRSTRRSDTAAARESLWRWCERVAAES